MTVSGKVVNAGLLLFLLFAVFNVAEKKTTPASDEYCDLVEAPTIPSSDSCDLMLSCIYVYFVVVYLVFLGCFWVKVCLTETPTFLMMKWLLAGIILIKVLSLTIFIVTYGSDVYYYLRRFLYVLHLVIVIQLIISGWTHLKTYLCEVDLVFLKVAATLQLLAFVATIVIGSYPTYYLKNVKEMFLLVDFTSCFTVSMWFFSTYGLMKDGNDERLYRLRQLFSLVVGYLLIMSLMRELGDTIEPETIYACFQMLRIKAVVETISVIFYSLLLNVFKEYFVHVDQPLVVRVDQAGLTGRG